MSSVADEPMQRPAALLNVPNQLTIARLVLSIVLFVLIAQRMFAVSTVVFIVAASTDWLDGFIARRYGLVTVLGRILDPFVDKVIICGTFIFLVAEPQSELKAWMAVVVVGRELLVTALRGYLEQQGADFSASLSGKLKMVVQCVAAGLSLWYLHSITGTTDTSIDAHATLLLALRGAVWAAVALTVWSGVEYIFAAIRLIRR
jgi:CDP-diacylglycerol--glycerol-3-phosphate 3-phosphatidyltransferase